MKLSLHTDYGLRLLMHAALKSPEAISVREVALKFDISAHHLMKVAQHLTREGFIAPFRGRAGGFRLARPPEAISIGEVVRSLEPDAGMVECMGLAAKSNCPIICACRLPKILSSATSAFMKVLDSHTLAGLVVERQGLIRLLGDVA